MLDQSERRPRERLRRTGGHQSRGRARAGTPFAKGAEWCSGLHGAASAITCWRSSARSTCGPLTGDDDARLRDALDEKIATNDKNKKLAWKIGCLGMDARDEHVRRHGERQEARVSHARRQPRARREAPRARLAQGEAIPLSVRVFEVRLVRGHPAEEWRRAVTLAIYTYTRDAGVVVHVGPNPSYEAAYICARRSEAARRVRAARAVGACAGAPRAHISARPAPLPSRPRLPRACPAPGERGPFMSGRREPMDVKGLSLYRIAPRGCCVPWLRGRWRSQGWIAPAAMPGRLEPLTPQGDRHEHYGATTATPPP